MEHLIAGERNPKVLAQLARGKSRRRIGDLEQALEGAEFFTADHATLLAAMLARIDRVTEELARLTQAIEQLLAPYEEQLQQAESMPGWARRAAQDALAETGLDMSRFPAAGHLSSWACLTRNGRSPGPRGYGSQCNYRSPAARARTDRIPLQESRTLTGILRGCRGKGVPTTEVVMEPDDYLALISWAAGARARSAATRKVSAGIIAQSRQLAAETARLQQLTDTEGRTLGGQAQDGGMEAERR